MREYGNIAILVLTCALSACGTAPPQANQPSQFYPPQQSYWMNPYWQAGMFEAVQRVVHLPDETTSPAAPEVHGTVKFLYDNGTLSDPEIVTSTGNPNLDKLMLQQVVTAKIPKPFGLHTEQPHEFELPLKMLTPYKSFLYNVYAGIDRKKVFPRDPLLGDIMGIATIDFDYLDAKASHIVTAKSSGNAELDQASIHAVTKATMPEVPPGYAGKTIHLLVIFCYDINYAQKCPMGGNVIDVSGTRILRRTVVTY